MDKIAIDPREFSRLVAKAVKLDAILRYIDECAGNPDKKVICAIADHSCEMTPDPLIITRRNRSG